MCAGRGSLYVLLCWLPVQAWIRNSLTFIAAKPAASSNPGKPFKKRLMSIGPYV